MTGRRPPTAVSPARRRVLASAGALASAGLAGCLGSGVDAEPAEPIALIDGQTCDVCGMTIADHFGPAGQIFYADDKPDGRDGPAWFDSVVELLSYAARRDARGWTTRGTFVTDYSSVDYDLVDRSRTTYISTHVAAAAFADATDCFYVVDSDVRGAMGEDYFPFSEYEEATTFADEHAGTVRQWEHLADR
ncbi:nitrous oxide reductase accessory protein NosL [Natrinema ejinorense]|uniref:Nitrous oxide reductase accessory protein NosL n=1 Tax=Natrinema ejinorense TaxID=373386 RepID=A0A2A5QY10_9EURY|nr:nitrous oxide reductase accessory protein NosL [Natrinema ejinorense]PCR91736.1 nitrous oxide reductase accessory protein NosL [Natrinema ejinorense]